MKFKKPIEQIEWDIQNRAEGAVRHAFQQIYGYNGGMQQPISDALSRAIGQAVVEGFKTMMENQYTDEDFEQDIGLKP